MDFEYDDVRELDVELKSDEKFPEISIIERNAATVEFLDKMNKHRIKLRVLAKQRRNQASAQMEGISEKRMLQKGLLKIRETVYQTLNPVMIKRYLNNCGMRLQSVGKFRYSTHYLEAAHDIIPEATCEAVQSRIANHIREGYNRMGEYQAVYDVSCLERDLFGANESKSVSCVSMDGKLVASREFSVGDVIFIEKPLVGYAKQSWVQCNCCLMKTLYTVPCAKCCAVFYCSVQCQRKDNLYHKYECLGLQIAYFTPVNSTVLVLRMFVYAIEILKINLSQRQQPIASSTMTAQQMWEILIEDHKHSEDFLKVFHACTCDHFADDKATYHILLQQVTLLMYYIMTDKQLITDYMVCWIDLQAKWPYRFMESVLLRLVCVTKLKACSFRYDLQFNTAEVEEINIPRNSSITSEQQVVMHNQYHGMYRFPMEMDASGTEFNAIFSLLDHGAVVLRATKAIKKGDVLVCKVCSFKHHTSCNFAPSDVACAAKENILSLNDIYNQGHNLSDKADCMLKLLTYLQAKELIYTADNFYDLLALFDTFIRMYERIPDTADCKVMLFNIVIKLETLYHKTRLIPLVLMQDNWMVLLQTRGVKLRAIKLNYQERLVNNLYEKYYQD